MGEAPQIMPLDFKVNTDGKETLRDYSRYKCFEITREGAVLVVSFNRPESLNAVNAELHTEL